MTLAAAWEHGGTMQTSRGEATPDSRWPTVLARVLAYSIPASLLPACRVTGINSKDSNIEIIM